MAKPPPAQCPGCNQNIRRLWRMDKGEKIGMRFRDHTAPCGLPCRTAHERQPGEITHTITEECPECLRLRLLRYRLEPVSEHQAALNERYKAAEDKIYINGVIFSKSTDPRKHPGNQPKKKSAMPPPAPKTPWNQIVIPPHALKMVKIRAGFKSVVDAANMIERLYPLAVYESSQKEAQGTSHTKRTKPGKNKRKSQRVDIYSVTDNDIKWTFYMKRNVLMTVHRNDDLDNIGARPALEILDEVG